MLLLLTEDTVFPPVVFSSAFLKSPASFSVSYCFPDTLNHAYKWPLIYNPDFAYQRENGDFFFFFFGSVLFNFSQHSFFQYLKAPPELLKQE